MRLFIRRRWLGVVCAGGALAVAGLNGTGASGQGDPPKAAAAEVPLGPNGFGLKYTPMPDWFQFQKPDVVQGWIDQNDTRAMTGHAWELWGGMTSPTTQVVNDQKVAFPIFETWVDELTVFGPPPKLQAAPELLARPFRPPAQLRHRAGGRLQAAPPAAPDSLRVVTVKYTKEIYEHVQTNNYYQTAVMNTLNQSWDKTQPPTPLKDRVVKPFPSRSIMLKPTYQLVSGSAATILPYWTGPAGSTDPSVPGVATWTKKMLVVPPGVAETKIEGIPVVKLDRFYSIKLNDQEAKFINAQGQGTIKAGDYAILVAMHVSSREIDNWTWQTFWWSIDPPTIPSSVRDRVKPPFDNYDAAVGYSFTTGPDNPAGLNVVCFNPYLEADFSNQTFAKPGQLGIESNCISCHRAATWPPPNLPNQAAYYTANGLLPADDPYFRDTTKVDFIWGFALGVPPPKPGTPPSQP